jgi:hypothetical protein
VPDSEIRAAWRLVNPSGAPSISRDATLAFLHVLNQRHEGFRIPRVVPASLRASFERGQIDYDLDRVKIGGGKASSSSSSSPPSSSSAAQRWGSRGGGGSSSDDTSTGRKAKFGDTYLSRLGLGGGGIGSGRLAGTDFSHQQPAPASTRSSSAAATDDWEEVRLKRQLAELEAKIAQAEKSAVGGGMSRRDGGGGAGGRRQHQSTAALVKHELAQLLDYKRRQLRELEAGQGAGAAGGKLREMRAEIDAMREQVDNLEAHLRARQDVLDGLNREIEQERREQ